MIKIHCREKNFLKYKTEKEVVSLRRKANPENYPQDLINMIVHFVLKQASNY